MRIWVTGAKGLVGAALSHAAPCPTLTTGREVDIADIEMVRLFIQNNGPITHIVNCAAFSQVDPAESDPEGAFRSNALGPEVLGTVACELGLKMLHLSTDYVFDGKGKAPLKESSETAPCNMYGITKLEGEKRLLAAMPNACILRTSWVFGKGGKNFVTKLLELLQTQVELKLVSDQTSRPTYAPDLVQVILAMVDQTGLYHFANAGPTNKYAFALAVKKMAEELKIPMKCQSIIPVSSGTFSSPAVRPLFSALDTEKIEPLLKRPIRHWSECLSEYLHEK